MAMTSTIYRDMFPQPLVVVRQRDGPYPLQVGWLLTISIFLKSSIFCFFPKEFTLKRFIMNTRLQSNVTKDLRIVLISLQLNQGFC